jgi:membrane fusion protein (multidrug efflux system)
MTKVDTVENIREVTVDDGDPRYDIVEPPALAQDALPTVAKAPPSVPAIPTVDHPPIAEVNTPPKSRPRRLPTLRTTLMAGGILVVVIGSGVAWLLGGRYATTDDAYVQAAKLPVSTDVSGLVASVDVRNNQPVKSGQVLFRIDPRQFQIALDNARANLSQTALTIESIRTTTGVC